MTSVYFDTNIVLDILDSARRNHPKTGPLLQKVIEHGMRIVISEDCLSTIYYIAGEKRNILDFFDVVLDEWDIVPFGEATIRESIDLCRQNEKLDFKNVLQCLCAKRKRCSFLITSDRSFVECGVKVVDIDTFMATDL